MDTRSIGFFDSGWGGLSVMSAARDYLPYESFCYVADCSHAPYGDQSIRYIQERARNIVRFLIEQQNVKAICIACNTATAAAAQTIREEFPCIPILGVEPAIKPAAIHSKNHTVGMISTTRTLTSERYLLALERFKSLADIISVGCPGLMECVEQGAFDAPQTKALLAKYLAPIKDKKADSIVLGCTHYPFLKQQIQEVLGYEVTFYEPGLAVAKHLKEILKAADALNETTKKAGEQFFVSGLNEQRMQVCQRLWENPTDFKPLMV